jgi:putative ABC transport system permease protein
MFGYYIKLAILSIRKNPILSSLMVTAIALGIGACMTTVTVNYLMSSDPIPHKSEQLFHVQVDSWDPNNPWGDEEDSLPNQLTWIDTNNLTKAKKAYRQAGMGSSGGVIEPQGKDSKPYMAAIRLTFGDFFAMFDVPFLYGTGWTEDADTNRDMVVVISKATNDRIFGGENSVGKTLRIAGHEFQVVGVLNNWQPIPRFYDVTTNPFDEVEDVFMPLSVKEPLELNSSGNVNCWKSPEGEGFKAFLYSECVNYQMWVQLRSDHEQAEYLDFLNAYAQQQKDAGRFPRPINNRLLNVTQWMEEQQVVEDDAQIMLWLSFMFLTVCLLNTIGLLLAKFSGKSSEIGLRRAVGASKSELFKQHLVESACIGVVGGLFGLLLALLGLQGIKVLYGEFAENLATMNWELVLIAILLAISSSVLAGLYPTWRACNIAPASQLKSQ